MWATKIATSSASLRATVRLIHTRTAVQFLQPLALPQQQHVRNYVSARTPQTETHKVNSFTDLGKRIKKTLEGDPAQPGNYGTQNASQYAGAEGEKDEFYTKGFSGTARLMNGKITKIEQGKAFVDLGKKFPAVFTIQSNAQSNLNVGTKVSVRVSDESFAADVDKQETTVELDHVIGDVVGEKQHTSASTMKNSSSSSKSTSSKSQSTGDMSSNSTSNSNSRIKSDTGMNDSDPVHQSSSPKPFTKQGSSTSTSARYYTTKANFTKSTSSNSGEGKSTRSDSSNEATSPGAKDSNPNSDATLADDIKRERPMSGKSNMPGGDPSTPAKSPETHPHSKAKSDSSHGKEHHDSSHKKSKQHGTPASDGKHNAKNDDPNAPPSTRAINYDTV